MEPVTLCVMSLIIATTLTIVISGFKNIPPNHEGLLIVLGAYQRKMKPGTYFVLPLISRVVVMNLEPQKFCIPSNHYLTRDNHLIRFESNMTLRVTDSEKAYFEISDYKISNVLLCQEIIKSLLLDMDYKEIKNNLKKVGSHIKIVLSDTVVVWGIKIEELNVESVELVSQRANGIDQTSLLVLGAQLRDRITIETSKFGVKIDEVEFEII